MSNTGQAAPKSVQAFKKTGPGGPLGSALPFGLQVFGAGLAGAAVLTSLTPAPVEVLAKASRVLTQVGLDKGPLLLFGATLAAVGFALSRIERMGQFVAASGGHEEDDTAQEILGDLEGQAAILASVQGEISSLRAEVQEARAEAEAARPGGGAGEASDPMFRLAASLDQLGASVTKRLDSARQEMLVAVKDVAERVDASASSEVGEFDEQTKEFEALRMDIADLRAQITRVTEEVTAAVQASAAVEPPVTPTLSKEVAIPEGPAATLPWELSDGPMAAVIVPDTPEAPPQPDPVVAEAPAAAFSPAPPEATPGPQPAPSDSAPTPAPLPEPMPEPKAPAPGPPQVTSPFGGLTAVPASGEQAAPQTPVQPVQPTLEFPEPPSPLPQAPPQPSEGLQLIDDMDEDTARAVDLTPPLFPELGGNEQAG